jgi:hypothetical protein
MDRAVPLAFVARPETLRRLPSDAVVLPLSPEVRPERGRLVAAKPEEVLGQSDEEEIEREAGRVVAKWWEDVGPDPFLWRDVNVAECFSGVLELVIRDLMKTAVVVERVIEGREPQSLLTDVQELRGLFPVYPYLDAIGSLIGTIAAEEGWTHRLVASEVPAPAQARAHPKLVHAYLRISSRKAMAAFSRDQSIVAVGPYPEYFRPVASAWGDGARSTVVLTAERAPMRAAPRSRLLVATLESFVDSGHRQEIRRFTAQTISALDSMALPTVLEGRWRRLWAPLRVDLRARFTSEIPDLAAAGIAFDHELGGAAHVVLLETGSPLAKAIVRYARRHKLPVTVIQHGIIGGVWSYRQTEADRVAAWGPADAEWFAKTLGPRVRTAATGSPRYDRLTSKPGKPLDPFLRRIPRAAKVVTFASQPFVQDRALRSPWDRLAAIEMALRAAATLGDFALVVKWHPAEQPVPLPSVGSFPGPVWSTQTSNTLALVRRSSAVLALSSTVALEAMYLDRAVVFLGPADPASPFHPPEDGGGLRAKTEAELVECLRRLLHDGAFRERMLEGQRLFLRRKYAPLDGRAAERVVAFLRSG